jgi:hypothetical protein
LGQEQPCGHQGKIMLDGHEGMVPDILELAFGVWVATMFVLTVFWKGDENGRSGFCDYRNT